jgi:predicted Zn finger-like uncharacterized protein
MDVKCERCNTEYEFDDALVSGRGTTVKCTNCGHKFKIRRSDGDFSEDFWNVTTGDGRTLVFTSLRELQRAIQSYLVERNDRLSRGGLPQKPIGQIPELAPFFEQREAAKKQQQHQSGGRAVKTQDGLGPAAADAREVREPSERSMPAVVGAVTGSMPAVQPPMRPRQATKPEFPAPPASDPNIGKTTLVGTGFEDVPSQGPATERQPPPAFDPTKTVPMAPGAREPINTAPMARPTPPPAPAPPPVSNPPPTPPMAKPQVSHPPPLPDRVRRSGSPSSHGRVAAAAPPPLPPGASQRPPSHERHDSRPSGREARDAGSERNVAVASTPAIESSSPLPPLAAEPRVRSLLAEIESEREAVGRTPYDSSPDGLPPPRRRSVGGFIVSAVVLVCLALLGVVWAQKNLGVTLGTRPPPAPAVDPRVPGLLAAGEKALADGNLELAKEDLDKASALAEKNPRVLLGLARLAENRADVLWLKSRLLPPDAADEHRVTRDGLVELAAGARKAADDALGVAPDDPAALRAKIDALRISGDRDGARALVGKIASSASQPESAYVLAALDLAEVDPLWPTVIERLKLAANVETGPGRARAALVYALARSGDPSSAKAEVERLASMTRPHPLLPLLRSFAEHAKPDAHADGGASAVAVEVDAGVPASTKPGVAVALPAGAAPGSGGGSGLPGDPRQLVSQGERARAKGDYDRARTLFNAALDKNPADSEALAGLAAIAYAQRDLPGARTAYKRVLAQNPNYLPAQVGLADVEWDSGDKATAARLYKDIADRYPEGTYPPRVKQRAEGGG